MALSARDRRAVALGGAALGVIGVYLLVVEPLARTYDRMVGEHEQLAAKVARVLRDQRKAEHFAAQIREHEQLFGELLPPRPYDEQITAIGGQLVAAAQMSGVMLRGSTPTAATPWAEDPALELASFVIDAEVLWRNPMAPEGGGNEEVPTPEAAWENVFKFVAGLYRIPGVLSVEQLELATDQRRGGESGAGGPGGGSPGGPGGSGQGARMTARLTVSVLVAGTSQNEERGKR